MKWKKGICWFKSKVWNKSYLSINGYIIKTVIHTGILAQRLATSNYWVAIFIASWGYRLHLLTFPYKQTTLEIENNHKICWRQEIVQTLVTNSKLNLATGNQWLVTKVIVSWHYQLATLVNFHVEILATSFPVILVNLCVYHGQQLATSNLLKVNMWKTSHFEIKMSDLQLSVTLDELCQCSTW